MKKLLYVLLTFLSAPLWSQPLAPAGFNQRGDIYSALTNITSEKDRKKLLATTFVVNLTGNAEIDKVFRQWGETVWKFKPVIFANDEEYKKYNDNDKYSYIHIESLEVKDDIVAEHYFVKNLLVYSKFGGFSYRFDALKPKESEQYSGIDRTGKELAGKLWQLLMLFTREVSDNSRMYLAGNNNLLKTASNTEIKSKTLLIPSEYLELGLKKEDFAAMKYKHEFMPAAEIIEKIKKGGAEAKGYAQFIMTKIDKHNNGILVLDADFNLIGFSSSYVPDRKATSKPINAAALAKLLEDL